MSAVAQTDAATHAANEKDIVHEASIEERLMIRDTVPLRILVSSLAMLLRKLETDFDAFVQLLPEIDPETLDPNNRNCTVCWDDFKLQSKNDSSGLPERDSTPLQLPCSHRLCKACIQDWLLKTGTCPFCRLQCCPRIGPEPTFEHEQLSRFREAYEAIAEIAPVFLANNPNNNTFFEFDLWLFAGEADEYDEYDLDDPKVRAQWAMDAFEEFTNTFADFMRKGPEGRQRLMEIRAVRAAMEESGCEDEEQDDERLDDADAMSEGYVSNDEKEKPMDDDEEGFMEGEGKSPTAAAAMGEEEDSMDEGEDFDELGSDGDEEDSMDEGEDFDEEGDDDTEWGFEEIEVDEQHTPATVLGCAAIVSITGIGILIASQACTNS